MFLPSIAFAAFIAVAANARGDGSATLQPDDKGIEDKQHVLLNRFSRKNKRELGRKPPFVADSSSSAPSTSLNMLRSQLKDPQSLIDASTSKWVDECIPEFNVNLGLGQGGDPPGDRSNWALIDQDSGLCTGDLFSAFTSADPDPNSVNSAISNSLFTSLSLFSNQTYDANVPEGLKFYVEDENNPRSELPDYVLFPHDATDVIHAVKFASKNHLRISIKTSGHSYHGGSTRANTLLLNMRKYKRYANETIVECNSEEEHLDLNNLSNQPCKLALDRNKPGYIRVGGGEVFADSYGAVSDWNKENGFLFHLVGGNAATVSSQGWTMDGGLGATAAGRLLGFGVDQPLQYEMVLANGHHVRFGPTKWEKVDDFDVPKTLEVTGVCRLNPEERDESKWVWGKCPGSIPFDELWFAVRGGGGGWGCLLSTFIQLHDYPGKLNFLTLPGKQSDNPELPDRKKFDINFCLGDGSISDTQRGFLVSILREFDIQFGLAPLSLEPPVNERDAYSCASPLGTHSNRFCFGDGAQVQVEAWKAYLERRRVDLGDLGFDSDMIKTVQNCTDINSFDDYVEELLKESEIKQEEIESVGGSARFSDRVDDSPQPLIPSSTALFGALLVPKSYILENVQAAAAQFPGDTALVYNAFGGFTAKTSDQMNALSSAHRDAGFWFPLSEVISPEIYELQTAPDFPLSPVNNDTFFEHGGVFQTMYGLNVEAGETGDNFPAFLGLNHLGPNIRGPLKHDWTKACPVNWTRKERDEKCIPALECVFGTQLLRKLERIKKRVDRHGMFTCRGCVGDNFLDEDGTDDNKYTVTAVDIATGFQSNEHKESVGYNMIDGLVSLDEGIRSVIVLEKGEVVMNYSRDVNSLSDPFEEIGSQTKAIISLIMGKLIEDEDYDLTLDTTLGEIFPDDADWTGASWDVQNVEERKTISILELLTMTSGLSNYFQFADPRSPRFEQARVGKDGGGEDTLSDSLTNFDYVEDNRGSFQYLGTSNIFSYVILKITTLTPGEYFATKILPDLGIDEIVWDKNGAEIENAFVGMRLTPLQQVKFGQLYLQQGQSKKGKQLVSKQWIDDSLTEFVDRSEFWNLNPGSSSLGYLWQENVFPGLVGGLFPIVLPLPEDAWCRVGLLDKYGGVQIICLDPSSERVVATLRDAFPPYATSLYQGQEMNIAATAMNDMISFQDPREGFRSDKCGNFANEKKCTKAGCVWDDAGGSCTDSVHGHYSQSAIDAETLDKPNSGVVATALAWSIMTSVVMMWFVA